ncbi:helix-turn-helix domain-containing protein [Zavarzinella formosa]|uniref:helix-turn-helix domain-containing protein n=1 Tax=Zavarzinella formosa TaxID=360055 RepID=UPI0002FE7ED7|nr:helix-turn-helix domain-containing protein [Zavarzinella formosa]
MSRRRKDPLRPPTDDERHELLSLSRSRTAPLVARAVALLGADRGLDYQQAAREAGRRSGDTVSRLVSRFNHEDLEALEPRQGGGQPKAYSAADQKRILREVSRVPTPEKDGTAAWLLTLLRDALRAAADGLPNVSTFTIWQALHNAVIRFNAPSPSVRPAGPSDAGRPGG